jgi:mono/diheme cytochrome c family protein
MDPRLIPSLGLAALLAFAICSCGTNPNSAFPTAQAVAARVGEGQIADVATLERGRKIYTTSCTECHVARPIAHYSVAQWRHYVSIMAPRAGLKPPDKAAVEAYVIAARESRPPG